MEVAMCVSSSDQLTPAALHGPEVRDGMETSRRRLCDGKAVDRLGNVDPRTLPDTRVARFGPGIFGSERGHLHSGAQVPTRVQWTSRMSF